jgi:catechol 2,3-dioxygenase-like lactoylglutathione lyase family enzyme
VVINRMDHTICLATADRSRSLAFYRDGLGLEAFAAQVADPDGHLWMILVTPPDWSE